MKKTKSIITALILVLAMAISPMPLFAQSNPEDMGHIPVREFFEETVGAAVTWDGGQWLIHIDMGDSEIVLMPGQEVALANGVPVALQDGVSLWQGRSFITEADLMALQAAIMGEQDAIIFHLTEEARDLVLQDFDYMVNFILENSVWDNILYRGHQLDFHTYTALFRDFILSMEPIALNITDMDALLVHFPIKDGDDARSIAANYLFALLLFEFAPPIGGIGHLEPRDLSLYQSLLAANIQLYHELGDDSEGNASLRLFLDSLTHPNAVWFYGEVEVDLGTGMLDSFPNIPSNIVTEVLIPGEVAYLRINSFVSNPFFDDQITLPFLQQVHDYDHLVIDLRGNGGGLAPYFNEFIVRRLINQPIEIEEHLLFTSGDGAMQMLDATMRTKEHTGLPWYKNSIFGGAELLFADVMPIEAFIQQQGKTEFDQDDLARLTYAMVYRTAVFPADDAVGFSGQIWLLVDGQSASASVLATGMSLSSGFATVVGENTTGVKGVPMIYTPLPNTGILWRTDVAHVVDASGRSLEIYGLAPDIHNFDGMDALETVLALIAE